MPISYLTNLKIKNFFLKKKLKLRKKSLGYTTFLLMFCLFSETLFIFHGKPDHWKTHANVLNLNTNAGHLLIT